MSKIITVTLNTAMDCLISEKEYNRFGNDYSKMKIMPAGKGINVSRALASKGEKTICLAFAGLNDKESFETVSSDLINTDFTYLEGSTRKNITISECEDGLEHHETNPGFMVNPDKYEELKAKIFSYCEEGDIISFSGSLPRGLSAETYKDLIKAAHERKLIPILDTSGKALIKGVEAGPCLIKPNLEELQSLCSQKLISEDDIKAFIKNLSQTHNIEYVLTTLSGDGALLYIRRDDLFLYTSVYSDSAFAGRPVISSVGCGDCSLAGFIYGLKQKKDPAECLSLSMKWAFSNLYTEIPGDI